MGQYAHIKNPGLYLNTQLMELIEMGLWPDGHNFLVNGIHNKLLHIRRTRSQLISKAVKLWLLLYNFMHTNITIFQNKMPCNRISKRDKTEYIKYVTG